MRRVDGTTGGLACRSCDSLFWMSNCFEAQHGADDSSHRDSYVNPAQFEGVSTALVKYVLIGLCFDHSPIQSICVVRIGSRDRYRLAAVQRLATLCPRQPDHQSRDPSDVDKCLGLSSWRSIMLLVGSNLTWTRPDSGCELCHQSSPSHSHRRGRLKHS
jgi:hypothetical protein